MNARPSKRTLVDVRLTLLHYLRADFRRRHNGQSPLHQQTIEDARTILDWLNKRLVD